MKLQKTISQPRKPQACDNCLGQTLDSEHPDRTPKKVTSYNIFPHGVFELCDPCADDLRK